MNKDIKINVIEKGDFKSVSLTDEKYKVLTAREDLKKINIGNTFFIKAYCEYAELKNVDFIEDIVKVFLPSRENGAIAKRMLLEGIYINDERYIAYTSTPSLQKKEDNAHKSEFIFIKYNEANFIKWFHDLISLNKFNEKFINKKIAINKKVTSRISLAFSDVTKINCYEPRIIVVDNPEYIHTCKVDMVDTEGKGVDRKILLDENGVPKLILNQDYTFEHEAQDGMGIMSLEMANVIKQSMNLDYDVEFAVCRMYNGLAVKGLCVAMNMVQYFEEYNKNCDGEYGCYTVKDIWGKSHDIRECDLLLTKSQTKWADNWKDESMDEINKRIKESEYRDLISALYVTKVNKNPAKLNTHMLTNYQLIGNIDIEFDDYKKLAKPTFDLYKGVLDGNMYFIKIFLKDFSYEDEACENDEDEKVTILPSTVAETLLNVNLDFYKMNTIKDTLNSFVKQKIKHLKSGKVFVRGLYTYVAQDPIALLNRLIGIETSGELKENEFYCNNVANKEYVIQRCPCNCFNEIVKIKTTTNDVYKKYLSHLHRELLILNAKDSTATRMSTMDFDGDAVNMIDEQIIIDSVIHSDTFFINQLDGESEEDIYNRNNRLKALYECSGNQIGEIAILGATISNKANKNYAEYLPYLYTTLLMQQIAIDCPKTMVKIPDNMFEALNKVYKFKKPYFMMYRELAKGNMIYNNDDYVNYQDCVSVLDRYALYCKNNIKINERDKTGDDIEVVCKHTVIPICENFSDCKSDLSDLWDEYQEKINEVNKWYEEKEEVKELNEFIEQRKKNIERSADKLRILKYDLECCSRGSEFIRDEIYEGEKRIKKLRFEINQYKKELRPYIDLKKNKKAKVKAEIGLKALDLQEKYSDEEIINAIFSSRKDGKKHTFTVVKWFFDTVVKYMKVDNCYSLEPTKDKGYGFEFLDVKYKRVKSKLEVNNIALDAIISNFNKAKRTETLNVDAKKVSLRIVDKDYNHDSLIGMTCKVGGVDENNLATLIDENGEVVGSFFNNVIKGTDVNICTIEKIKIYNVDYPKTRGKSIYLYFTM